ncbi:MAG TPA: hypothetical protein VI231_06100 [Candidatus Binatia bacterium]
MADHAVIVDFVYGKTDLEDLSVLEDQIIEAIDQNEAGEFDGNEIAVDGSEATLYMYGPDADRLFAAVKPVLDSSPFMRGATVRLRYGPPEAGVREIVIRLPT